MLLLTSVDPMRFAAVCETCRAREDELRGTRAEVVTRLHLRGWRIEEEKDVTCPDCAGPPSVFPAGKITPFARHCSVCRADASACDVCHGAFTGEDVMSCRGQLGHAHTRCATQKMRKFLLPDE